MRSQLQTIYRAAILSVEPSKLVAKALSGESRGAEQIPDTIGRAHRIYFVAVGKAARAMGAEVARRCGRKLEAGLVVAPKGSVDSTAEDGDGKAFGRVFAGQVDGENSTKVKFVEAAHPLPDGSSVAAARAALKIVGRSGHGDVVVVALSGGASALMAMPVPQVTLEDKVLVSDALMRAGATIHELNAVRKHLSAVKGGGLLRATRGAIVLNLVLSDVVGNDLGVVGSGPAAADSSTFAESISVLKRRGVWGRAPESVREYLEQGAAGVAAETLKPKDPLLAPVINVIVGDNGLALDGADEQAQALGFNVRRWRALRGRAEDLAVTLASDLAGAAGHRLCLLSGGEPVVTVRGQGRGGRAQHLALATAIALDCLGAPAEFAALFAGSDGVDGNSAAAGAFIDGLSLERAARAGVDAREELRQFNANGFFAQTGDLFVTGPTGTNVADLAIALVV